MLRNLRCCVSNATKRLVKSPKVYLRDSGILHALLEIDNQNALLSHPVYGQSWKEFALENLLVMIGKRWRASFYRSEKGNEIDLFLEKGERRICIKFKSSSAPQMTKGFYIALDDIQPEQI
ncbi:MAG: DUF4143 domain-containing protein [Spirochaetales bacterium]|nr:DUF4143 domain-containing protein [Spirochaetales bacterium]